MSTYEPYVSPVTKHQRAGASRLPNRLMAAGLVALVATLFVSAAPLLAQAPGQDRAPQVDPGEAAPIARRAALRFITEDDYPPFNYRDEDGSLTGFNVDIARAICQELSAACDIQVRPWTELLPSLKRGEADAVIASHATTPRLLSEFDLSDRYYHTPARFVARRGTVGLTITPEGLEGKRIAVVRGSAHEVFLRAFFTLSAIETHPNAEVARDAIVTGSADLLFDDGMSLVFWLNGLASKACCQFIGGPFAEPRYFTDGVGIVMSRDDAELKSQLNIALKRIRDGGRYEELMLRYFPLRAY
jgi:polar amino acid transport system substrate-binding protein